MASAKVNVPLAPPEPLPRQTSRSPRPSPPPPSPLRPKMATEPPPVSGVLKCSCFRLPSRTKKALPPPPAAPKYRSASRRSAVAPDVSAATASQSQRVTFSVSVSLSSRWPSSPSAASAGAAGAPAPRSLSSPRVTPHGERASFSFAVSPSSCTSTPKIPQGWQQK